MLIGDLAAGDEAERQVAVAGDGGQEEVRRELDVADLEHADDMGEAGDQPGLIRRARRKASSRLCS